MTPHWFKCWWAALIFWQNANKAIISSERLLHEFFWSILRLVKYLEKWNDYVCQINTDMTNFAVIQWWYMFVSNSGATFPRSGTLVSKQLSANVTILAAYRAEFDSRWYRLAFTGGLPPMPKPCPAKYAHTIRYFILRTTFLDLTRALGVVREFNHLHLHWRTDWSTGVNSTNGLR